MRGLRVALVCAAGAVGSASPVTGCSDAAGPSGMPIVGAFCTQASSVSRSGNDATVTLRESKTVYEDRARESDGVVIRHEVRSCEARTCVYNGGAAYGDQQLIDACKCQCLSPLGL